MKHTEKKKIFKNLSDQAIQIFEKLEKKNGDLRLKNLYSFYVSPGGSFGKTNPRHIEIFYGQIPYDVIRTLNSSFQITEKLKQKEAQGFICFS